MNAVIKLHYPQTIEETKPYELAVTRSVWKVGLRARICVVQNLKNFPVAQSVGIIAVELFNAFGKFGESFYRAARRPSWKVSGELAYNSFVLLTLGSFHWLYSAKKQEADLHIGKELDPHP